MEEIKLRAWTEIVLSSLALIFIALPLVLVCMYFDHKLGVAHPDYAIWITCGFGLPNVLVWLILIGSIKGRIDCLRRIAMIEKHTPPERLGRK